MKRQIMIKYWWKCEKLKEIPQKLQETLEELAEDRIFYMMEDGCTSGELIADVNIPETSEDNYQFRGWWEITKS